MTIVFRYMDIANQIAYINYYNIFSQVELDF